MPSILGAPIEEGAYEAGRRDESSEYEKQEAAAAGDHANAEVVWLGGFCQLISRQMHEDYAGRGCGERKEGV
jgi:hypothetical protein